MSYSPVCSVLVETHKVGTDRNCLAGSSPFLSPSLSVCVCVCHPLEQNDFDYYLSQIMQSNIQGFIIYFKEYVWRV